MEEKLESLLGAFKNSLLVVAYEVMCVGEENWTKYDWDAKFPGSFISLSSWPGS